MLVMLTPRANKRQNTSSGLAGYEVTKQTFNSFL